MPWREFRIRLKYAGLPATICVVRPCCCSPPQSRRGRTLIQQKGVRLFPASVRRTPLTFEGTSGLGATVGTLVPQILRAGLSGITDAARPVALQPLYAGRPLGWPVVGAPHLHCHASRPSGRSNGSEESSRSFVDVWQVKGCGTGARSGAGRHCLRSADSPCEPMRGVTSWPTPSGVRRNAMARCRICPSARRCESGR